MHPRRLFHRTARVFGCRPLHWVAIFLLGFLGRGTGATATAAPLKPRAAIEKPARTVVNPRTHQTDVVSVKFRDGLTVRLRNGNLSDLGTGDLARSLPKMAPFAAATWQRVHALPEARLDQLRDTAQRNTGRAVADLNLDYFLRLPAGADPSRAIDALNALDVVELAAAVARPVAAPLPPNFQPNQGYLGLATAGIGATCMWLLPGGAGGNVKVADLEYSWNLNHLDLAATTLLGAAPTDPFNNDNHGTAVLGEMVGLNDGSGVTGLVYGTTMYVAAVNTGNVQNVAGAITTALGTLAAGDVLLIEQQYVGPNYTGIPAGTQFGLVPVEWSLGIYNAIVTAVGNGVIVVEAGGNGSQNLDAAVYGTGNGGHWPFLPLNDSGAIIVGAGAVPGGSDTDRSRLAFSNYGSTLDLQGWGEKVYSTGYGDAYNAEGKNRWYTAVFSGTSSASPIVASACAALQSSARSALGAVLTPAQVKNALQTTGSAQQAGTYPVTQNIGPRPNVPAAIATAAPGLDSNSNLVPDLCDGLAGLEACCFPSGGCTDTTAAHCIASGGTPQGPGSTCATANCPTAPPTEACCLPNNTCQDLVPAVCTMQGGTPMGPGTNCATANCVVMEACCFPGPLSQCADMPVLNCQLAGGLAQGPGTACATAPCPIMVPKFSQPPTQNRDDIASNIDLATMNPSVVVADDFQSDGRPITAVRWWGSYLDPRYQPVQFGGMGGPFQLDGWLISFHEPLASNVPLPPQPPLGLYFAPAAAVTIRQTAIPACDGHAVYEFIVEIPRCCRLQFMADSRSGWVPAQREAFEEQHCFLYDIDIQAAVGGNYTVNAQTGMCMPAATQTVGTGQNIWGWHSTDVEKGVRAALMSFTQMGVGGTWLYGPWAPAQPVCAPMPVNMAFELLTNDPNPQPPCPEACCFANGSCLDMLHDDCILAGGDPRGPGSTCATTVCNVVVPKFEQPPLGPGAHHASNLDWNLQPGNRDMADDFRSDGRPITSVRWWGAYLDPRYQPAQFGGEGSPHALDGWLISFHEPLSGGPTSPAPPLGLYFAPAGSVRTRPAQMPSCDGLPVYEYTIEIDRCCLLHAMPDSRSGQVPAQIDAFHEQHCYWYDLDIQAVVGHAYSRDSLSGLCLTATTANIGAGPMIWGWHDTMNESGRRSALLTTVNIDPLMNWFYGPWFNPPAVCAPPPPNLSFSLLTTDLVTPPACPCPCPGDVNGDALIDGDDINGFVACLLGTGLPGVDCACADLDGLGGVDTADVPLLVAALLSGAFCP